MDHSIFLNDPGICIKNSKFYYNKNKKLVTDSTLLTHLKSFKVPPAWNSLWYASNKKCHIHVYGTDASGKKQYIFSDKWINSKKYEKFCRMKQFIKKIDSFKKLIKPLTLEITKDNIIKLLFNLLLDTHIRVGNEIYSKVNNTYGLTTLRKKHLKKVDNNFLFRFTGKSKIKQVIKIPEKYNKILQILNNENNQNNNLFYYVVNNEKIVVTSEDLNTYLKNNMGSEFSCKDFRTYSANVLFVELFLKNCRNNENNKKVIETSIEETAKLLGHSKGISKKSYISENLVNFCLDSFQIAKKLSVDKLLTNI